MVYNTMEHVTTCTMVAQQVQNFERNHNGMLSEATLIDHRVLSIGGQAVATSLHARPPCGHVHAGDLIVVRPFGVARVLRFIDIMTPAVSCSVQIERFEPAGPSAEIWRSTGTDSCTVGVDAVVCPVIWRERSHDVFRTILPTIVD